MLRHSFFGEGAGERATGKGKLKENLIHLLLPFAFQRKREGGLPADHRLLRRGHTCTKRSPPPLRYASNQILWCKNKTSHVTSSSAEDHVLYLLIRGQDFYTLHCHISSIMISLYDHLSFFLLGLAPSFIMVYSARAWVYTCGVTLKEKKRLLIVYIFRH